MELFDLLFRFEGWSLATIVGLIQVAGEIVGIIHIPSVLLRRSGRPGAQLTWIMCLILLPFVGVVLWWLMGRTHLHRKRRRRAVARAEVSKSLGRVDRDATPVTTSTPALLVEGREVFATTGENVVQILTGGRNAYPAFEEAIRLATHSVHLSFYIWNRDAVGTRLRDLLVEKAAAGVEVRLLYDAWGAAALSFGGFMDPIRRAGGRVAPFLPLRLERQLRINFRNHRKMIICDGAVGFTGGLNIGDEYNDWYDLAVRVQGGAVDQLQEVFAEDWYFATDENIGAGGAYFRGTAPRQDSAGFEHVIARVVASGPDSWKNITHVMFFLAITMSKQRIWITNPYFTPDAAILTALRTAAMRGVDVRLLLPGRSDVRLAQWAGRGYYEELLEAGVRIWEYQAEVLHAKVLMFDDDTSIVGSSNMDTRSFRLQFEVNLVCESHEVNRTLADEFECRLQQSQEILPAEWSQRPTWKRLRDAAARLLSPVL